MSWIPRVLFEVPGIPKGQPRARAFARNGMVRMYDPATAEGWKSCIAGEWKSKVAPAFVKLTGPVKIEVDFYFPRPKNHYRTGKHAGELKPGMPAFHTGTPDADNCLKAVMDCLTRLGAWVDAGQVMPSAMKYYATGREPGATIRIFAWNEQVYQEPRMGEVKEQGKCPTI